MTPAPPNCAAMGRGTAQRRLRGGGVDVTATDKAFKNARRLRRDLSLPEKLLWVRLRGADVRFRRQHPIGPYVLDFYCDSLKLCVEMDDRSQDFRAAQ